MNYKMMGRFLSQILFLEGALMVPALGISLYCGDSPAAKGFLIAIAVAIVLSVLLYRICRGAPSAFYAKEGFICVAASWIVLSLVGCLPFCLSGRMHRRPTGCVRPHGGSFDAHRWEPGAWCPARYHGAR